MKKIFISLAVAMMLVAVMAMPAMAATSGTTDVTGDVVATVDVTAPANFSLGNMSAGATTTSALQTGTVKANANWQVTAEDEKGTNTGYMVSGTDVLANEMEISDDGSTWYPASGSPTLLTYSGSATGEAGSTLNFYARQQVTFDDTVTTGYTITITFTGSLP